MQRGARDPWAGEKMTRSDAGRRYANLITYQLRPMLADRRLDDEGRIAILKRIIAQANRFRYESGVVAGAGSREEVQDLLMPFFHPEHPAGEELRDWIKRVIRAFGAAVDDTD
jgi:hypothetical protein